MIRHITMLLLGLILLAACGPAVAEDEPLMSSPPVANNGSPSAAPVTPETTPETTPEPSGELPPSPDARRIPGIISHYQDGTEGVLTAPETVRAGEEFEVTITTFGGGCESAGGADVEMDGNVVTIDVFDWTVAGPAVSCIAILKRLPRTVMLSFPEPGPATIRVQGVRAGEDVPGGSAPFVLEQPIVVQ